MAYSLGLDKQQARVWGANELAVSVQGLPALQPRYVLLDAATKRPVPGQQIRRKGQALEVWVDGKLVLVLPAFFTPKDGVESLNDLHLASLDGALSADQLTNPEEHTTSYLLTEEAWDTENTFDLSELAVSPTSWRESDLWAQASGHESMANATMTDAATGAASATTSGAVSTTVTGSVSGMGLGAVGLLLGMSTIASHVNNKVSVVPGAVGPDSDSIRPATPSLHWVDTGSDANDGVSSATMVTVIGLETGASWEYSLDGGVTWQGGSNLPGNAGPGFMLAANVRYALGAVQVRQTDAAGNPSGTVLSALAWTIDNTAPAVSLSSSSATLKVGETATITLVFSEAPAQLPSVDSAVGSFSAWTASADLKTYTATFTPRTNTKGTTAFTLKSAVVQSA